MNNYDELEFNKKVDARVRIVVPQISRGSGFTDRKLTDTPNDGNQVVSRRYVNLSGTTANRPVSSVATVGQRYLATDTRIPLTYTVDGWVNGVGSIVALNN